MLKLRPSFNHKWLLVATLSMAACATNPNKAQKLDTKVENQSHVSGDTSVGLKNGDMIVQRKVLMSEELRRLQFTSSKIMSTVTESTAHRVCTAC